MLAPEPPYPVPTDPLGAFLMTGYSECIDSFFSFRLFEAARRTGYFPEALVETFEPVIQEEARHILFFANWVAWYRRNLPLHRRPWFFAKTVGVWIALIRDRLSLARGMDTQGAAQDMNFRANVGDSVGGGVSMRALVDPWLVENERRLAGYDPRLLRARIVPWIARRAALPAGRAAVSVICQRDPSA